VRVEVENDGPPVPPESVRAIFEPFQTSSGGTPGAAPGLGLGLFIVRSIVEAHGGTVEVLSAPESPVTFTVHLPRAPPAQSDAAPASFWRPTSQEVSRDASTEMP
jgi:signal transduction histidine kinase